MSMTGWRAGNLLLLALLAWRCGGQARTDDRAAGPGGGAGAGAAVGGSGADGSGGATGGTSTGGSAGGTMVGGAAGAAGVGGGGGQGGVAGVAGGLADAGAAAAAGWSACTTTSECVVRPGTCCGSCGAATRGDAVGVNRKAAEAHLQQACASGEGCDLCFMPDDPTLVATCSTGSCRVVDLLALPLTACSTDADCRIRTSDCCECGGSAEADSLIAVRVGSEPELVKILCDPMALCDDCDPGYPEYARAACHAGRCTVTGSPGTTPK